MEALFLRREEGRGTEKTRMQKGIDINRYYAQPDTHESRMDES